MSSAIGTSNKSYVTSDTSVALDQWRWVVMGVFGLSSSLNYLDRQLLAAVAPALKTEFGLTNAEYGGLISAFSLTYMFASPITGVLLDKIGLRFGSMLAVLAWSIVGTLTAFVRGFSGLFAVRMGLGAAESAGIPSSSKASATYLRSAELGLGNAVQSFDITLGAITAPLIVAAIMPHYGWRSVFVLCGLLGFVWSLVWWITSRLVSTPIATPVAPVPIKEVLRDSRLWGIVAASALVMTVQSLWMNWTTIYLVQDRHLSQLQANEFFAWIPPIFGTLGALAGATWAYRLIRRGESAIQGRMRTCLTAAPILLITVAVPFLPSVKLAVAGISLSLFGCMMVLINAHVIPIDLFGPKRAAFTSSVLVSSFALMQVFLSPLIGVILDRSNFKVVCTLVSILSVGGIVLLSTLMAQSGGRRAINDR